MTGTTTETVRYRVTLRHGTRDVATLEEALRFAEQEAADGWPTAVRDMVTDVLTHVG